MLSAVAGHYTHNTLVLTAKDYSETNECTSKRFVYQHCIHSCVNVSLSVGVGQAHSLVLRQKGKC